MLRLPPDKTEKLVRGICIKSSKAITTVCSVIPRGKDNPMRSVHEKRVPMIPVNKRPDRQVNMIPDTTNMMVTVLGAWAIRREALFVLPRSRDIRIRDR